MGRRCCERKRTTADGSGVAFRIWCQAYDLYHSKGSLDRRERRPGFGPSQPPAKSRRPCAEWRRLHVNECVGPAVHGGLEHEFVTPLKLPASIKAAAAPLAGKTRSG